MPIIMPISSNVGSGNASPEMVKEMLTVLGVYIVIAIIVYVAVIVLDELDIIDEPWEGAGVMALTWFVTLPVYLFKFIGDVSIWLILKLISKIARRLKND